MQKVDYIIVGQGLAGTLMAYSLMREGKSVMVIDNHHKSSASVVAAGIMNPITGRKFVKSWRYEEFIAFAKLKYKEIEKFLDNPVFVEKNILRALFDNEQINNWSVRNTFPGYATFFKENVEVGTFSKMVKPPMAYGEVKHSGRLLERDLVKRFQDYLIQQNALYLDIFDFDKLEIEDDYVRYKNLEANRIIFCEGWQVYKNPYFNHLPFTPAKGEIFLIKIPNYDPDKILKHELFLVPFGDDIYWVGSNYNRNFKDDKPTNEGYQYLKDKLDNFLEVPYEIVEHQAAIRPATRDRRPIIGQHLLHKRLYIFSGFGAKGASLGPFWANHLTDYLMERTALIDQEVSLVRFYPKRQRTKIKHIHI